MIASRTTTSKFLHSRFHHSIRNRNPSFSQLFPRAIILPSCRSCGRSFAQFRNSRNSTCASKATIAPGIRKSNMTTTDNLVNNKNSRCRSITPNETGSNESPTPVPPKIELESMKVADLKQLVKDSGLNERGLLSKLKKKQDLIVFLDQNRGKVGAKSSGKSQEENNAAQSGVLVSSHYESHSKAESYDEAFFYEPGAYMEYLVQLVGNRLGITRTKNNNNSDHPHTLLDIGGGTGTFARALLDGNDDSMRIVVVDPFLEQAKQDDTTTTNDKVSFVRAPAEDFMHPSHNWFRYQLGLPLSGGDDDNDDCWRSQIGGYNQILLKEVVHHFDAKNRIPIFKGMINGMIEGMLLRKETSSDDNNHKPSLLIVTRPQTDIDYPLWDAARKVWKENQPSVRELSDDLLMSGFTNIQSTIETYKCSISLSRWQNMVRTRCWSTFSNFSDAELEHACDIIARDAKANPRNRVVDGETMLEFDDRLVFLQARAEIRIPFHVFLEQN